MIPGPTALAALFLSGVWLFPAAAQTLIKPAVAGDPVVLLPSDMATLESPAERKDLPCVVTPRKTELGFDLRFQAGYDVTIPLKGTGGGRRFSPSYSAFIPREIKEHSSYFPSTSACRRWRTKQGRCHPYRRLRYRSRKAITSIG